MTIITKTSDIANNDFREGALILINKPLEWSSFSVVNKLRWKLRHHYGIKKIKVGHGGTLDPLATGLLLIFTGRYTKKINEYMGLDKKYSGTVKLGAVTASYDAEQPEQEIKNVDHLSTEEIKDKIKGFEGWQDQKAPIFSALKVNGQPMYKKARKGDTDLVAKVRKICFHEIQFEDYKKPYLKVNLHCSKGSYIRSFAHDLGESLKVGGYLSQLERTAVGDFELKDAIEIEDFVNAFNDKN